MSGVGDRVALALAIRGAGFAGTAPQPDRLTVVGALHAALTRINDGRDGRIRTSGRLDAGVDAAWLVIGVDPPRPWPDPLTLARALNANLPDDVVVIAAAAPPPDWDALASPSRKTYRYRVLERGARPLAGSGWHHLRRLPDPEALHRCASQLRGSLNLAAFACRRGDGSDPSDPRRTIDQARWWQTSAEHARGWCFEITGEGFLYKQVRGLVGAMLACGCGSADESAFTAAIGAGYDHPRVGAVAPAVGLQLVSVRYQPAIDWQWV